MNNTFFCVCVWVGFRLILFPLRDHLDPLLKEVRGKNRVEFFNDSRVLRLHDKSLEQASKKQIA